MMLVLGIGNTLRSDDGAGVRIIEILQSHASGETPEEIVFLDGGTLGLSLLPQIENASALIAADAAETGSAPGTVHVFEGEAMDAQLGGKKRTVHEVALADLLTAAALTGHLPARRALVTVQPASTAWGLELTAPVSAAIPAACEAVLSVIGRWKDEG
jgi:hydrogenase maturation protease